MFGETPRVVIYDEGFALITYTDFFTAYIAQQSFNDRFIASHNVTLIVKWMPKEQPCYESDPQVQTKPTDSTG